MIGTKNSLSSFVMSFDFSQGFGTYIQVHLFDMNNAGEKTLICKQYYCIITHLMTAQRTKEEVPFILLRLSNTSNIQVSSQSASLTSINRVEKLKLKALFYYSTIQNKSPVHPTLNLHITNNEAIKQDGGSARILTLSTHGVHSISS